MEQLEILLLTSAFLLFILVITKYTTPYHEDYTYLEVAIAYDIKNVEFYTGYNYGNITYHKSTIVDKIIK